MKSLFYDMLNGYTLNDFTLFFIQLFCAVFIGQLTRFIVQKRIDSTVFNSALFALIPLITCFLVIISKNSAPLSISVLGIFILTGQFIKSTDTFEKTLIFVLAGAGFGCGAGYVMVTLLAFVIIILPVLYFASREK